MKGIATCDVGVAKDGSPKVIIYMMCNSVTMTTIIRRRLSEEWSYMLS